MSVLTLTGKPINWSNPPSATTKVKWSYTDTGGDPVMGSLFVIAALDHLSNEALKKFGQRVTVIQPPFNTGVKASAGTHDFDYCMDWWIAGVGGLEQQTFARWHGWADWWRQPWQGFSQHQHGFPMPPNGTTFPTKVGIYVPGQLTDYWHEAYGLKDYHYQSADPTAFPTDAQKWKFIFNLTEYINQQKEEAMEYKDWSDESKKEFAADVAKRLLDAETVVLTKSDGTKKNVTIRSALQRDLNDGA